MDLYRLVLLYFVLCLFGYGQPHSIETRISSSDERIRWSTELIQRENFNNEHLLSRCSQWLEAQRPDGLYFELRMASEKAQLSFEEQGSDLPYKLWSRKYRYLLSYPWLVARCSSFLGYKSLSVRRGGNLESISIPGKRLDMLGEELFGEEAEIVFVDGFRKSSGTVDVTLFVKSRSMLTKERAMQAMRIVWQRTGGSVGRVLLNDSGIFPDVGAFPYFIPFVRQSIESELLYYTSINRTVTCAATDQGVACQSIQWLLPGQ